MPAQLSKLGNLTTPFGAKTEQEAFHPGVDIANKKGTPIPAFAGGVVQHVIDGRQPGENNFGNSVIVKDKQGLTHRYSHLANVGVRPGQQVSDGQHIGTMGDSGAAYSPTGGDASNLDYRIMNAYGQYVDPSRIMR
jgi:murein DD-endopeptidase MepM/ murein hydrolase activator NlpD